MAVIPFGFSVRSSGALTAGLTPTWSTLRKLSDGTAIASPLTVAPIVELAGGLYKISYDPEGADGELFGVIDAGASITSAAERYIEICLAADSSRVTRLDAAISTRSTYAGGDTAGTTTLLGRLTGTRANNLDNLDAAVTSRASAADVGLTSYRFSPLRSGRVEPVRLTRGATSPDLQDSLIDGTGNPIDLTGRTITASLLRLGGTYIFENRAASLGDWPAGGQVLYEWQAGDLDTVGRYTLLWSAASSPTDILRWSTEVVVE